MVVQYAYLNFTNTVVLVEKKEIKNKEIFKKVFFL